MAGLQFPSRSDHSLRESGLISPRAFNVEYENKLFTRYRGCSILQNELSWSGGIVGGKGSYTASFALSGENVVAVTDHNSTSRFCVWEDLPNTRISKVDSMDEVARTGSTISEGCR